MSKKKVTAKRNTKRGPMSHELQPGIHNKAGLAQDGVPVKQSEPSYEELARRVRELEQMPPVADITFRVSNKGAVSVYGLGRFPVTLYYEQWCRLLDRVNDLRNFLTANKSRCKLKGASLAKGGV